MTGSFIVLLLFLLFLLNGVYRVREHERFVVFRLGRFFRVMGPGWIFMIPVIDQKNRINLDRSIPEWNRMSGEELNQKIKAIAFKKKVRPF
jgi:regulator of protease activity HflC (stomatin/prohibitin superfamily)